MSGFQREGIRALLLKGPAWGYSIYPHPSTRPSGDIDILVLPEMFQEGRRVLEALGYKCWRKRFEVAHRFDCEEVFVKKDATAIAFPIELHWDIHKYFGTDRRNDIEGLFNRSECIQVCDTPVDILSPVDALIHAALHLALTHNRNLRLIWLYDIGLLAGRLCGPEDWRFFVERASASGAGEAAALSLQGAGLWTNLETTKVSLLALEELRNSAQAREKVRIARRMATSKLADLEFRMRSCPTIYSKCLYLLHFIFPPPHYVQRSAFYLRGRFLPIAYIIRWFRLFTTLIRAIGPGKRRSKAADPDAETES